MAEGATFLGWAAFCAAEVGFLAGTAAGFLVAAAGAAGAGAAFLAGGAPAAGAAAGFFCWAAAGAFLAVAGSEAGSFLTGCFFFGSSFAGGAGSAFRFFAGSDSFLTGCKKLRKSLDRFSVMISQHESR